MDSRTDQLVSSSSGSFSLIPRSHAAQRDEIVSTLEDDDEALAIPLPNLNQLTVSFKGPYNRVYIADLTCDVELGSPRLHPGESLGL